MLVRKQRILALIDIIGTKRGIRKLGKASRVLDETVKTFYEKVSGHVWLMEQFCLNCKGFEPYETYTFSDSSLITSLFRKSSIDEFILFNTTLCRHLRVHNVDTYLIVSLGDEIEMSNFTKTRINVAHMRYHHHIAGLGSCFADCFLAEKAARAGIDSNHISPESRIYIDDRIISSASPGILKTLSTFKFVGFGNISREYSVVKVMEPYSKWGFGGWLNFVSTRYKTRKGWKKQ